MAHLTRLRGSILANLFDRGKSTPCLQQILINPDSFIRRPRQVLLQKFLLIYGKGQTSGKKNIHSEAVGGGEVRTASKIANQRVALSKQSKRVPWGPILMDGWGAGGQKSFLYREGEKKSRN